MYKIETHLHTPYISCCAHMPAEEIVSCYQAAGYAAITVTDHYNRDNFRYKGIDLDSPDYDPDIFLEGYRRVKAAAEPEGLRVYYGAELRFPENMNDYLLYGFAPSLLEDARRICAMSLEAFIPMVRESGAVLFQAHPFRTPSTPANPEWLDGVEIANRCKNHQNRNELAAQYGEEHQLLTIGGSDFHGHHTGCCGGILADELPEDSLELARLLRSGKFEIL